MVLDLAYGSRATQNVAFDQNTGIIDAFGRLRTSEPQTLFSDRAYYENPCAWDKATVGDGAVTSTNSRNSSTIQLSVGTGATDSAFRQTRERVIYQPGKSQQILMTFVMEPTALVTQRVGYFSIKDGIYIENDSINTSFVVRSNSTGSITEERIIQSNWNIDKMDGTGPSKMTLDISKAQLMIIDFEWLGVGSVRVGFIIDNKIVYVHEFMHANVEIRTYMGHGSLPCRYEIFNTGTSVGAALNIICAAVTSEGGHQIVGNINTADSGTTAKTSAVGVTIPLVSFRLNPISLNAALRILSASIFVTSNNQAYFRLIFNGTLTSPVWTNIGSISQFDNSATAITGGTVLHSVIGGSKSGSEDDFNKLENLLGFGIDDTPDHYTITATSVGGNVNLFSTVNFVEFY